MTNFQIITTAAIENGLYTEDEAMAIIAQHGELPLHTFREWRRMGYTVRKGEHAALTCDIWRFTDKRKGAGGEAVEDDGHFYKKVSHFFTAEQVERVS